MRMQRLCFLCLCSSRYTLTDDACHSRATTLPQTWPVTVCRLLLALRFSFVCGVTVRSKGRSHEGGLRQHLLTSGLPALLPAMYDVLCIAHAAFSQMDRWVGFYCSSASRYVIARVYGLTNEVQKRYMTKCIGDTVLFLLTLTRRVNGLTNEVQTVSPMKYRCAI